MKELWAIQVKPNSCTKRQKEPLKIVKQSKMKESFKKHLKIYQRLAIRILKSVSISISEACATTRWENSKELFTISQSQSGSRLTRETVETTSTWLTATVSIQVLYGKC